MKRSAHLTAVTRCYGGISSEFVPAGSAQSKALLPDRGPIETVRTAPPDFSK